MAIKLEDYEESLQDVAPEVRDVLHSTFQEASRVMSPTGLQTYMDGAKSLCNLGISSFIFHRFCGHQYAEILKNRNN